MSHRSYYRVKTLLDMIDEPNRSACHKIWDENYRLFETEPGSRHNHQAWVGGYADHVAECLNYANHKYDFDRSFGRFLPFSRSDALLVLFLHDLEKPWRELMNQQSATGTATKQERQIFREQKFEDYGITLTPYQHNGVTYVEGEILKHSSTERVMNELAAFCNTVDVWSARIHPESPQESGDRWVGARRFRTAA